MSGPGSVFKPHFVFYMDDDWRGSFAYEARVSGVGAGFGGSPGTLPAQKAGSHERDKRAAKCPPRGHPSAVVRGWMVRPSPAGTEEAGQVGRRTSAMPSEATRLTGGGA